MRRLPCPRPSGRTAAMRMYACPPLTYSRKIFDDVSQASEIVVVHVDNVAGVKLPVFKSAHRDVASGHVSFSFLIGRRPCAESRWSAAGEVPEDMD